MPLKVIHPGLCCLEPWLDLAEHRRGPGRAALLPVHTQYLCVTYVPFVSIQPQFTRKRGGDYGSKNKMEKNPVPGVISGV